MKQIEDVLKMYADIGMRTIEDWSLCGREIINGVKARAEAASRGVLVALYTRDQTHIRSRPSIARP
jgi:hypothetical protein